MTAARKGNVGIVRKLIHHGTNMNLTNKVKWIFDFKMCSLELEYSNRSRTG